jgi:hypothetical protein
MIGAERIKKQFSTSTKKRARLLFLTAGLSLFLTQYSVSQDLHFSQWFNAPLITNPANTGFIPDADYRIGANYRNQWSAIMTVPYKTFSVWGDAQLFRDRIETGWLGVGCSDIERRSRIRKPHFY